MPIAGETEQIIQFAIRIGMGDKVLKSLLRATIAIKIALHDEIAGPCETVKEMHDGFRLHRAGIGIGGMEVYLNNLNECGISKREPGTLVIKLIVVDVAQVQGRLWNHSFLGKAELVAVVIHHIGHVLKPVEGNGRGPVSWVDGLQNVDEQVMRRACRASRRAHFIDAENIGARQIQNAGNPCIPCRNTSRCTANSCRAITQEVVIHDAQAVLRQSLLHQTQHQQEHPA